MERPPRLSCCVCSTSPRSGGEIHHWVQLVTVTSQSEVTRKWGTPKTGTGSSNSTANRTSCRSHLGEDEYMATNSDQPRQPEPIDRRRLIISTTSSLLILVLCLFLPAGTWAWFRGWLFLGRAACVIDPDYALSAKGQPRCHRRSGQPPRGDETLGSILVAIVSADDAGDPDRGSPGRRSLSLVPRTVVGLRAGLCPPDHRDGGSDLGTVGEQVLRADRPHPDRSRSQGHRHRSLRHRPASGIRLWPTCSSWASPWHWVPGGL